MPTRGRREMAARALECWRAQTWPNKELVIVDDADDPSFPDADNMAAYDLHESSIVYHLCETRLTVGAKRNLACSLASGEVIMCVDSDDWMAPERTAWQMGLLDSSGKAVTAVHSQLFQRLSDGAWFKYHGTPMLAMGNSLAFWKHWWESHRFEDKQCGQDEQFGYVAFNAGQLNSVDAERYIIASAWDGNTSSRSLKQSPYKPVLDYDGPDVFGLKCGMLASV
jgi:glycosyltransferase involved in cell wall biosynthesis